MEEKDFFNETTELRTHQLNCPKCGQSGEYKVSWVVWFVLLLLGAIVYPFALVCLGRPTTLLNWAISGLCVLFIFTVFYTPWYTLMGGVLVVIVGSIYILKTHTFYTYTDLLWVLFIFLLFGIVQKTIRVHLKKNNHTPL